jgi:ATP synthase F1 delta subunit
MSDDSHAFQFGRVANRAAPRHNTVRLAEVEGTVFPDDASKYPFAAGVLAEARKTKTKVDSWAVGLYEAAANSNVLGSVAKDMAQLEAAWTDDVEFFISSPARQDNEKMQMVDKLASTLQFKNKMSSNFMKLVTKEGDLEKLPAILDSFTEILRLSYGIYFAKITSYSTFTQAQEARLKATLEAYMGEGADVQMEFSQDPSLAGGFVVSMEGMNLDVSLKNDLGKVADSLTKTMETNLLAKAEAQEEILAGVKATHVGGGGMDWVAKELAKVGEEVEELVSAR